MSLLSFDSIKLKGGKKTLKVILGISALAGVIALGSTLAASINLNAGAPVEFGQGVAQATACDSSVLLTPESTFVNSEGGGEYKFTSVTVSDISEECFGKEFTIKAYKNGQNSALPLYLTNGINTYSEVKVYDDSGSFSLVDAGLLSDDINNVPSGFKVSFVTLGPPSSIALSSAQDVDRITIESKDYSASGSLSFNNNSISYEANDIFKFGTNDFTIESWAYISSSNVNATIYDTGREVNSAGGLALWVESNDLKYRINGCWCQSPTGHDIAVPMAGSTSEVPVHNWFDSWHHYALTRTGGIERLFVDGTLVASSYDTTDLSFTPINTINLTRKTPSVGRLDGYDSDYFLNGKIDSLRVINGTARYTSNFNPPAQLTNETGTVLLLDAIRESTKFQDRSNYHSVPSLSSALPTWTTGHH
jgi:hypothetical protein